MTADCDLPAGVFPEFVFIAEEFAWVFPESDLAAFLSTFLAAGLAAFFIGFLLEMEGVLSNSSPTSLSAWMSDSQFW